MAGKKGKKSKSDTEKKNSEAPSEREIAARVELEKLNEELQSVKNEVERLRKENEWLKDEANRTKMESHEYLQYMSRKAQKRQSTIAMLNEKNEKELEEINAERKVIVEQYETRKQELKDLLATKDAEYAQVTRDLQDLAEYQTIRLEQEAEIGHLETEVERLKIEHAETLQQMKSNFLKEKVCHEQDADQKIKQMKQKANDEAVQCLVEHTQKISGENKLLRKELLNLIRRSQALTEHKLELQGQSKGLLREHQITKDLRKLRKVHIEDI